MITSRGPAIQVRSDRPVAHRRGRAIGAWLVAAVVVAACGSPTPTPTPTPTPAPSLTTTPVVSQAPPSPMSSAEQAALYAAVERDVETIRELVPKRPVSPVLLDEAGLRAELELHSAEDNPPADIARQERLLKALGVLVADANLESILKDFLTGQIAGFYRPKDGQLYVVSRTGEIGGVERTTFAHEYTHALQDQHFPLLQQLDGAAGGPENGDRDLARLSLIEGDATMVMTLWAQQHLSGLELLQLLRSSLDPGQQAALAAMPPFLRESALFPYQSGLQFVMGVHARGGWGAVNTAFEPGPDSTEQILHADKWASREAPADVTLAPDLASKVGPGWSSDADDTLGEFQLRLWLNTLGVPSGQAATAAAGWGGDRVSLLRGPDGRWLLTIVTRWDTERDALEFQAAADAALATLASPGVTKVRSGAVVVFVADDPSTLDNISGVVLASGV